MWNLWEGFGLFVVGFCLLKLSFRIADEPLPPTITKYLYLFVGLLSFVCVAKGMFVVFAALGGIR